MASHFCQPQVRVHGFFGAITDILPPEQVCTAVPSRLRHVSGQIEPALSIPWIDPYVDCLEWVKAEDLRNDYRHSPLPERVKKWTLFEHQDPAGCALLAKIKTNECPMLKKETEGGEAINQVYRVCSWDYCILADTHQDGSPQRSCSNMSQVWIRSRHGVPQPMADTFSGVHRLEILLSESSRPIHGGLPIFSIGTRLIPLTQLLDLPVRGFLAR